VRTVRIEGHRSAVEEQQGGISRRRALALREQLRLRGYPIERVEVLDFGNQRPLSTPAPDACPPSGAPDQSFANRRVEVSVLICASAPGHSPAAASVSVQAPANLDPFIDRGSTSEFGCDLSRAWIGAEIDELKAQLAARDAGLAARDADLAARDEHIARRVSPVWAHTAS
jgi:hypothetical protein